MGKPENAVMLGLSSSAIMNGEIGLSESLTGPSGLPTENCSERYQHTRYVTWVGSGTYYAIRIIDAKCLRDHCQRTLKSTVPKDIYKGKLCSKYLF